MLDAKEAVFWVNDETKEAPQQAHVPGKFQELASPRTPIAEAGATISIRETNSPAHAAAFLRLQVCERREGHTILCRLTWGTGLSTALCAIRLWHRSGSRVGRKNKVFQGLV